MDKIKAQEALTQRLLDKSRMLKQSKSCERFRAPSASNTDTNYPDYLASILESKLENREGLESEVRERHQED